MGAPGAARPSSHASYQKRPANWYAPSARTAPAHTAGASSKGSGHAYPAGPFPTGANGRCATSKGGRYLASGGPPCPTSKGADADAT